ncbi:hypothetical protein Mlute_02163 [Meiothermus luteus]|uniref:Uncharacterized protein n=1 Tax=Meiothermus luteus TaxID=2026184 RepID=A0A399EJR4_9DEIN|nr:hypothetical protein [Meiothermus luteus]RIH83550.1 hypothetical protein Mlute_02163 [Meiothermus luteus]RMH53353.1 MAG: hypothetical protein D6684_12720 [Deinococcota bacterium]
MGTAHRWGRAACFVWWLERLSLAVALRFEPPPRPAQVRFGERPGALLRLDTPYYPARAKWGYVFIPLDCYFEQAEAVLKRV